MNSIVMIGGVIASSTLLFAGLSLQRYIRYIRMAASIFLLSLIAMTIVNNRELLIEALETHATLGELWYIAVAAESNMKAFLGILPSIGLALLSLPLVRIAGDFANRVSVCLSIGATTLVLAAGIPVYLPPSLMGIIAAATSVIALLFHIHSAPHYHIVATSISGGVACSLLFTRFYYLPWWVFGILATFAIVVGLAS